MTPVVLDETDALLGLTEGYAVARAEYVAAQEDVVRAIESATSAIERASDLRVRVVALHAALLKSGGGDVADRPMYGTLPGGTSPDGLRERFRRAVSVRW